MINSTHGQFMSSSCSIHHDQFMSTYQSSHDQLMTNSWPVHDLFMAKSLSSHDQIMVDSWSIRDHFSSVQDQFQHTAAAAHVNLLYGQKFLIQKPFERKTEKYTGHMGIGSWSIHDELMISSWPSPWATHGQIHDRCMSSSGPRHGQFFDLFLISSWSNHFLASPWSISARASHEHFVANSWSVRDHFMTSSWTIDDQNPVMTNSWSSHGQFMADSWPALDYVKIKESRSVRDQLMISSWPVHDQYMIKSWSVEDKFMINSWSTDDQFMTRSWSTAITSCPALDQCHDQLRSVHDPFMSTCRPVHEYRMIISWSVHGQFMIN